MVEVQRFEARDYYRVYQGQEKGRGRGQIGSHYGNSKGSKGGVSEVHGGGAV